MATPDDDADDYGDSLIGDDAEEYWAMMESECHMDRRGQCGLAGSEWCEFECPFNR
jgi:hypothetical protein